MAVESSNIVDLTIQNGGLTITIQNGGRLGIERE
jgi:frataxin-like iron-binding protein CyaY